MTRAAFRSEFRGVENVWVLESDLGPVKRPDVEFTDYEAFVRFEPLTARARAWLKWRCRDALWHDGAVAVEPRYVMDLLLGMHANGLEVVRSDIQERENGT